MNDMLEKLLSMPIEKKIGQLFFVGLPGPELTDETKSFIREISPGGFCLFARNVRSSEQVRGLLDGVRLESDIEPFLSLDQEGGLVDRLRRINTPMPAASYIKSADDAAELARTTAETLRILGFNMNFAPVVDVIGAERAKFSNGLHSRAFGKTTEEVTEFAGVYLKTLQDLGIIGCLKHFPGLGGAEKDAHDVLPIVNVTAEDLSETDLVPYRELFKTGQVSAIMVAHATYPKTDLQETDQNGKLKPSSLNFKIVHGLLRKELGFEGIAITDDLEMGAVVNNYGVGEACRMAIGAGEDQLAFCATPESIREGCRAVLESVKTGGITESRIDESLQRIAAVKSQMSRPLPFDKERLTALSESVAVLNTKVNYSYGG